MRISPNSIIKLEIVTLNKNLNEELSIRNWKKISFKVLQNFFYFKRFLLNLFDIPELKNVLESEIMPYSKIFNEKH